jgi:hypothetical protein
MRIYADFNALGGRGDECALLLHRSGTLQDLHRLRLRLVEGETHTFWDQSDEEEDLEVDATVVFEHSSSQWLAEFSRDEIRYVPHQKEPEDFESYPCLRCRNDLRAFRGSAGFRMDSVCPSCGLSVMFPIAPPNEPAESGPRD